MNLSLPTVIYRSKRYDASSKTLTAPHIAVGECLAPWFIDNDSAFYDSSLKPRSGDLCLVRMTVQKTRIKTGATFVDHVLGCKMIHRKADGSTWFLSNDRAFPTRGHAVLGVMVIAIRYATEQLPANLSRDTRHVGVSFGS